MNNVEDLDVGFQQSIDGIRQPFVQTDTSFEESEPLRQQLPLHMFATTSFPLHAFFIRNDKMASSTRSF